MNELTGRELELHNHLLAHGAKRVSRASRAARTIPMPVAEGCFPNPNEAVVSALFWSEDRQEDFWVDAFFSRRSLADPDVSIEALANLVLRQVVCADEIMADEPTERERELHRCLLTHGATQVSNFAHTVSMEEAAKRHSSTALIAAEFWSEEYQRHFYLDRLMSRDLIDDPDVPIEFLAGVVLECATGINKADLG